MVKKIRNIFLLTLLIVAGFIMLFVIGIYAGLSGPIYTRQQLLNISQANASLVYARDGELIGRFFLENRTSLQAGDTDQKLYDALVATEDVRFYRHGGVDLYSMVRVLVKSVVLGDRSSGGGSTITQQLAKNIQGRNTYWLLSLPVNKTREIILARRLEKTFSKEDILLLYLNTVPFGENAIGVEAASRLFFSKGANELSLEESAVLVGMLKANTTYNPRLFPERSLGRRNTVLFQMNRYGYISEEEADSLSALPLGLKYAGNVMDTRSGYFLARLKREAEKILEDVGESNETHWDLHTDGLLIYSTLNLSMQRFALESFHRHLSHMQKLLDEQYAAPNMSAQLHDLVGRELIRSGLAKREHETRVHRIFSWEGSYLDTLSVGDSILNALGILHAGLIATEPGSGAIRIYVGGINHQLHPFDQVLARRQMASAFKPVIYAAALEEGLTPCSYFHNDSLIITDFSTYSPSNHDQSTGGLYSMAGALTHSMNIPTFHIYLQTGFDPINDMWRNLEFEFPLRRTPSLAMGTAEASVFEVARAYGAFANGGHRVEPYMIDSIMTQEGRLLYRREPSDTVQMVMNEETALLISSMLENAVRRGTASAVRNTYGIHMPVAGKTGTSQQYADAWFASFSPRLVMVSRVGANYPSVGFRDARGSGSSLALPLVALTMQKIQEHPSLYATYSDPFPGLSANLLQKLDCPEYREHSKLERFINIFRDQSVTFDQEGEKKEGRESVIRRIFGRRR